MIMENSEWLVFVSICIITMCVQLIFWHWFDIKWQINLSAIWVTPQSTAKRWPFLWRHQHQLPPVLLALTVMEQHPQENLLGHRTHHSTKSAVYQVLVISAREKRVGLVWVWNMSISETGSCVYLVRCDSGEMPNNRCSSCTQCGFECTHKEVRKVSRIRFDNEFRVIVIIAG